MGVLPVFPLGTVLVPGQVLPLQLFEPRYLRLHGDLMERPAGERAVGVVLIRQGHEVGAGRHGQLAPVGCEGVLRESRELLVDGRPLVAWALEGRRRLRIEALLPESAERPYLAAEVSWLDELPMPEDAFEDHARAAQAGLAVTQRQQLLECIDAHERAVLARRLIHEEERLRQRFSSRPAHEVAGGFSLN